MTLQMEVIVPQICKLGNGIQSSGDGRYPNSKRFALVHLRSVEVRQCQRLGNFRQSISSLQSCSRLCVALTMARNLALPSATVGYPTAGAYTPASKSFFENSNAFAASPTWIGIIGVSLTLN